MLIEGVINRNPYCRGRNRSFSTYSAKTPFAFARNAVEIAVHIFDRAIFLKKLRFVAGCHLRTGGPTVTYKTDSCRILSRLALLPVNSEEINHLVDYREFKIVEVSIDPNRCQKDDWEDRGGKAMSFDPTN